MLLDEIATLLEQNGFYVANSDTFVSTLPVDAKLCVIAILDYAGEGPSRTSGGVAADRPRIQIQVRHEEDEQARTIAYQVRDLLDGTADIEVNGTRYVWIAALQDPFPLMRDAQNRLVMVCNYEVIKER